MKQDWDGQELAPKIRLFNIKRIYLDGVDIVVEVEGNRPYETLSIHLLPFHLTHILGLITDVADMMRSLSRTIDATVGRDEE